MMTPEKSEELDSELFVMLTSSRSSSIHHWSMDLDLRPHLCLMKALSDDLCVCAYVCHLLITSSPCPAPENFPGKLEWMSPIVSALRNQFHGDLWENLLIRPAAASAVVKPSYRSDISGIKLLIYLNDLLNCCTEFDPLDAGWRRMRGTALWTCPDLLLHPYVELEAHHHDFLVKVSGGFTPTVIAIVQESTDVMM